MTTLQTGVRSVLTNMRAVFSAILMVTLAALGGCGQHSAQVAPSGTAFQLYTHCGPDWRTRFNGTYWDLESPISGQLGDPYQPGVMRLVDQSTASFTYESGGHFNVLKFRRHPDSVPLKRPIGCD